MTCNNAPAAAIPAQKSSQVPRRVAENHEQLCSFCAHPVWRQVGGMSQVRPRHNACRTGRATPRLHLLDRTFCTRPICGSGVTEHHHDCTEHGGRPPRLLNEHLVVQLVSRRSHCCFGGHLNQSQSKQPRTHCVSRRLVNPKFTPERFHGVAAWRTANHHHGSDIDGLQFNCHTQHLLGVVHGGLISGGELSAQDTRKQFDLLLRGGSDGSLYCRIEVVAEAGHVLYRSHNTLGIDASERLSEEHLEALLMTLHPPRRKGSADLRNQSDH